MKLKLLQEEAHNSNNIKTKNSKFILSIQINLTQETIPMKSKLILRDILMKLILIKILKGFLYRKIRSIK
jgi:hypothetical protein